MQTRPQAGALATLLTLLRELPATDLQPGANDGFIDREERDIQVVRMEDGAPLLLVFCGNAYRFGAPLNLMHRWLRRLQVNLVYLRDFRRVFYLSGIRSLGAGYTETLAAFRHLAQDLGASDIVCTGNSAGTYGALRFGLDLGARAVLAFSGPTSLHRMNDSLLAAARKQGLALGRCDIERSRLSARYARSAGKPRVRIVYGAENRIDRMHAVTMAGVPGVELVEVPGWDHHAVLGALIARGTFEDMLAWLVTAGPIREPASRP